jgi:protoheme IX farnesyltransferase
VRILKQDIEMKRGVIRTISDYLQLCRYRIALFAALSAGFGYVVAGKSDTGEILALLAGVFILAAGASGLNQYQERRTDALMARTKKRPIPSGSIKSKHALYFAMALMAAGLCILSLSSGLSATAIGLSAAVWYNGIYTYLKRKTAFAAVPGGLTGALVPAIGWAAASGSPGDPRLIAICIFFGLWQVPHFWLLALEYGKEYEAAGLPSITLIFDNLQVLRITFVWIIATAVSGPMLLLFNPASSITRSLMLFFSLWLIWQGSRFMRSSNRDESRLLFFKINCYMLAVIVLLSCDSLYLRGVDIVIAIAK